MCALPESSFRMNQLGKLWGPIKWAMAVGVAVAVVTLFIPNQYRSEVRILPVDAKGASALGSLASAAAAFGVGLPGQDGGDSNFIDVLNSRWMRESLLSSTFKFRERAWMFGEESLHEETLLSYLKATNLDQGVGKVGLLFSASRDPKSKVLAIAAETKSPELSLQLVQRGKILLEQFVQQKSRTRGGAKAVFAEARLGEAWQEMELAESALRKFLDVNRNYMVSADPSVRLLGGRLEMELKLRQQLVATLSMNREQALMEEKDDLPILNVLDAGNLPIEKSRPARSLMILSFAILGGLIALGAQRRDWLLRLFQERSAEQMPSEVGDARLFER